MSVTFSAAFSPERETRIGYRVSCYAYGVGADFEGAVYGTEADAMAAHAAEHATHPDCEGSDIAARAAYAANGPTANFANGNAARVLALLGYATDDLYGSDDPDGFGWRIEAVGGPCPDDDGHDAERLRALLPVVAYCRATRQRVSWA